MFNTNKISAEKGHGDDDSPKIDEAEITTRTSDEEDDVGTPKSSHSSSQGSTTSESQRSFQSCNPGSTTKPNFGLQSAPSEEITRMAVSGTVRRSESDASRMLTGVASRHSIAGDSNKDQDPPPDGGRLAWTQAVCGWLCIFNTWGFVNAFGAFQTH